MECRELVHEAVMGSRGDELAFAHGHELLGEMWVVDHACSVRHAARIEERFRLK